jgi:rubrerythrin
VKLEDKLTEAAFWGEWICLGCGEHAEFEETGPACPECEGQMVEANALQLFIARLAAERENDPTEGF